MKQIFARAGGMLLAMSLLCGLVYTFVVTGIGQLVFPYQANGSVIEVDGKTYGSELMAQPFSDPAYLWGRPMNLDVSSFTDEEGNPAVYAWASNKSPASADYEATIAQRVEDMRAANPAMGEAAIPVDLVTCSGSGLDPEITPAGAEYQVARIAEARGVSEDEVRAAIAENTKGKFLGIIGEPTVNVLKVNLTLDGIAEN